MTRRRRRRGVPDEPSAAVDPSGRSGALEPPPAASTDAEAERPTSEQPVLGPGHPEPPRHRPDEPSPQVVDELLTFFGVRHHDVRPHAADAGPPDAPLPTETPEPSGAPTRLIDPAEPHEPAAPPPVSTPDPPAPPALAAPPIGAELVPAPTRGARRRSKRELKREVRREAKRLAEHARQAAALEPGGNRRRRWRRLRGGRPTLGAVPAGPADGSSELVTLIPPPGGSAPPGGLGAAASGMGADAPPRETVTIVDDAAVPDAVYLEGDVPADEGAGRRLVFIEDRDPAAGSVVSLEAATAAARMEPRLRERRIAVRRALGRKRLKWAAAVIAVVGVVVGTLAVLGSGMFDVTEVRIDGAVYSRGSALDAVVGELQGRNVLRVDTDRAEHALERIPWIADARVTTDFPDTVTIEVAERDPVLVYQGSDSAWRVVDGEGRVLDVVDGQPVHYLPLVLGTEDTADVAPGAYAPRGVQAAARLVPALGAPLRQQVATVVVTADGSDLRLQMVNGVEVRFGAAEDLVGKLVRLQTALTDPNPEHLPTQSIDVSTQDIVVR